MRNVCHDLKCIEVPTDTGLKKSAWTLAWLMKFFGVPPPRTTEAVRPILTTRFDDS